VPCVELLLQFAAQPGERVADERPGLEALEDRRAQALGHLECRSVAGRQARRPARDGVERRAAQRVIPVARRPAQLVGRGLARSEDETFADALATQQERLDGLALVPPPGRELEQ